MRQHTLDSTLRRYLVAFPPTGVPSATVLCAEIEALGYARGRMDAAQDHHLPWLSWCEPVVFARLYALHTVAGGHRYDIRTFWERYAAGEVE